jgi:hypothetical protein
MGNDIFSHAPPLLYASRMTWYVGYTAAILSGFYLMEMSMDRLIAVRFPMSAKVRCTTTKATRAIIITLVVVAVVNVHILLTFTYDKDQFERGTVERRRCTIFPAFVFGNVMITARNF